MSAVPNPEAVHAAWHAATRAPPASPSPSASPVSASPPPPDGAKQSSPPPPALPDAAWFQSGHSRREAGARPPLAPGASPLPPDGRVARDPFAPPIQIPSGNRGAPPSLPPLGRAASGPASPRGAGPPSPSLLRTSSAGGVAHGGASPRASEAPGFDEATARKAAALSRGRSGSAAAGDRAQPTTEDWERGAPLATSLCDYLAPVVVVILVLILHETCGPAIRRWLEVKRIGHEGHNTAWRGDGEL